MPTTVENNPLIFLYRSLNASDSRRLGKWMASPAHNQRDDVRALHAYLTGGNRLRKSATLTKQRIWKKLFPASPFDDARLRQTFHWALKAAEEFVAYEAWRQSDADVQLDLVRGLRQRGLSSVSGRNLKKLGQLQDRAAVRNEHFFRRQYRLEVERDEHRELQQTLGKPNFQGIADALDVTYLIEKLKISWNMLFHQRLYRTEFSISFLDEVAGYVSQFDLEKYPILLIHYYGYLGLKEDDDSGEIVARLRTAVARYGDLLPRTDLRYVILMAINLCISNINKQRAAFVREAFEWYKLGLAEDVITENGQITQATYLNIMANAIKLGEYDWVQDFITEKSELLEEGIRQNTEYYARARVGYEHKDYDTIMPLLAQVDFKHPILNLYAKTLFIKIYYELDEFDLLENQIDATLTYIRRKTLSDFHRDNYNNIARLTRQLGRLAPGKDKREALRRKIEAAAPLSEKAWLLEQLGE